MAKTFIFVCPFCGQNIECDDTINGVIVNCPRCKQEIVPTHESLGPRPQGNAQTAVYNAKPREKSAHDTNSAVNAVSGAFHSWQRKCQSIDEAISSHTRNWSLKRKVLGYTNQDGSFKIPLLAKLFYYAGIGFAVIALIIVVIRVCLDISEERCNHPEVYFTAAVIFADAVFNLGIAQIIYCIGKTAFNSDKIIEVLTGQRKK